MTYLLDTCILSKLRKISQYPDKKLETWISNHPESENYLSVLTMGEFEKGIHKLADEKHRRILEEWYRVDLIPRFQESGRLISINLRVASMWGELTGNYLRKGITIPTIDGLLAATAIVFDLTLVTENIKDFARIDELKLYSPWE